jgi:YMGG-like Gly-zipper
MGSHARVDGAVTTCEVRSFFKQFQEYTLMKSRAPIVPILLACVIALSVASARTNAATPTTPAATPAASTSVASTPTSKPLSTSLGLVVFPAKGQSPSKQAADEGECFAWSKGQTGVDPMALTTSSAATTASTASTGATTPDGSRARGALRGAAAGAIVGEVANNDAGQGAAIGATAGVMKGGADSRRARTQSEQQAQADAARQAEERKAAAAEQKALFNKGFTACLEARAYTIK